ncbi:MAG: hypothetical protein GY841_13105 [FCB group bacterium]|nr:hypothetical protein [FCB group bacterium]
MRTRNIVIVGVFICLGVFAATIGTIDAASDYVNNWLRTNVAGSSDGLSLKIESTSSDTLTKDFATTNTIEDIQNLSRTTTGTPAIGIGGSIGIGVETTVGNVEEGIRLAAVVVDETGATEDFSFDVMEMIAGAAAAKTFSIANGIVTTKGGATLDNTTAATELLITETNIQLSGIINLEGGNVVVNNDSGDYDFIVETDDVADALSVDAGLDAVLLGTGLVPDFKTADPCGSGFPEGSIFYNDTGNILCFCDGTNDLKISDGNACF